MWVWPQPSSRPAAPLLPPSAPPRVWFRCVCVCVCVCVICVGWACVCVLCCVFGCVCVDGIASPSLSFLLSLLPSSLLLTYTHTHTHTHTQADPTRAVDPATIMWQKEVESGFSHMLAKIAPMILAIHTHTHTQGRGIGGGGGCESDTHTHTHTGTDKSGQGGGSGDG
jgi:hypothetical protein